ncbi:MAG TPA: PEP-CTERM sorting domain-containing protein [Phycisphaerae bacterium]|nr:PEP-CTERM sorting domain-containing protein [Phycisphaerae bacterium]
MTRMNKYLAMGIACTLIGAASQAAEFTHVSTIDLSAQFNSGTGYGSNPLSVAFDGTNAYVGGFNNNSTADNIGVVKVSNIFGGSATFSPLAPTQFSSPAFRGLDALGYDSATSSVLMAHDSGSASTSFISRRDTAGTNVWTVTNPQSSRPMAMAVDPIGNGTGSPGVAFGVQGSGRRRLLNMADGTDLYNGSNGGIINSSPTSFGSAWRGMAFDAAGNIALSEDTGFMYGVRNTENQWKTLTGTLNATSSSVAKDGAPQNLVGQGIAIVTGLGSDLLAMSGRNMTQFTDLSGAMTSVDDTMVHLRNLDGSVGSLTQIALNGAEDGIGTPWTGDIKNLAFGLNGAGDPTLVVVDFIERRMDVYTVPEPSMLGALALAGLVALRRRRA